MRSILRIRMYAYAFVIWRLLFEFLEPPFINRKNYVTTQREIVDSLQVVDKNYFGQVRQGGQV